MPRILPVLALAACLGTVPAETVHQSLPGPGLFTGDGASAVAKGQMETRQLEVDGATRSVARLSGGFPQWGFVTAWFGLPAPAGRAQVRLRLWLEDAPAAAVNYYIVEGREQRFLGAGVLPLDAKPGSLVTVDVPVEAKMEWSGFVIKKADGSANPGHWIESVSVVLP